MSLFPVEGNLIGSLAVIEAVDPSPGVVADLSENKRVQISLSIKDLLAKIHTCQAKGFF